MAVGTGVVIVADETSHSGTVGRNHLRANVAVVDQVCCGGWRAAEGRRVAIIYVHGAVCTLPLDCRKQ